MHVRDGSVGAYPSSAFLLMPITNAQYFATFYCVFFGFLCVRRKNKEKMKFKKSQETCLTIYKPAGWLPGWLPELNPLCRILWLASG